MGLFSQVKDLIFNNLISNDPRQYVVSGDRLQNELVISMNNTGKSKISAKDAALLSKTDKEIDRFAQSIVERQENSITINPSDLVIRAKNSIEKWIKEKRMNKKIADMEDKKVAKKGDLPKDYIVSKAESTNGKIPSIPADELENDPRKKGGKIRDSRMK